MNTHRTFPPRLGNTTTTKPSKTTSTMKLKHVSKATLALGVAAALCASGPCEANTVSKPKVDAEGVTDTPLGDRTYDIAPSGPVNDITVPVKDLLEDGYYFEHQVQGRGTNSPFPYPNRTVFGNTTGPHSLSFYVPQSTNGTVRSELWFEGSRPAGFGNGDNPWTDQTHSNWIPWNQTRTTGFNLYLPASLGSTDAIKASKTGHGIIMQWWQYSGGSPPMALDFFVKDGQPRLVCTVISDPAGSNATFKVHYNIPFSDLGNWFDVYLAYKLSTSNTGSVEIRFKKHGETAWRSAKDNLNTTSNGSLVTLSGTNVKKSNIKIGFTESANGISHKFGIYRPGGGGVAWTIRFDNVMNGTTEGEVDDAWTAW
jgi:hypothetical protein